MRIIDLLNKIANREEVPKKIKISEWEYDKEYEDAEYELLHRLADEDFALNDEVEIIEEPQEHKIPEKLSYISHGDDIAEIPGNEMLMNKINEIIDYLEGIK